MPSSNVLRQGLRPDAPCSARSGYMSGRGRRRWRRLTSSHTRAETLLRVGEDARHNIGNRLGKGRAHEDAALLEPCPTGAAFVEGVEDRKSTRLNSSH